jgi:hypothetical protein
MMRGGFRRRRISIMRSGVVIVRVLAGGGNDTIDGGTGTDVCIGGSGTNTFSRWETQL